MTFSYDPAQLPSSLLFQVRYILGDTKEAGHVTEDEEIDFLLTTYNDNPVHAAYYAALNVSATYSGSAGNSKTVGSLSIQRNGKAKEYNDLANRIRRELFGKPIPSAGGMVEDGGGILLSDRKDRNVRRDVLPTYLTNWFI